jgi:3-oxoacyl-[acyl-carrier protein] reductase
VFKKKVVFITGSSSGLGYNLAQLFKKNNFKVIINGRNQLKLKKSSARLGNCDYITGDLTKKKDINKIIIKLKKKYNQIDLLICNQGNSNFKKNNLDIEFALKNNFFTSLNLIMNSKKILKKKIGKIICISSICGNEVIEGAPIGYSVAKSALNFFIKKYSFILAEDGITINGIMPGNLYFPGSVWEKKMKQNMRITKKYVSKNVPLNKFGNIDDIFSLCKFICDSKSNYITGSIFKIDGGQTKSL